MNAASWNSTVYTFHITSMFHHTLGYLKINIQMSTKSHSETCWTSKASAIMAFYSQLTVVSEVLTELYCL
jgi:hypothetical protein